MGVTNLFGQTNPASDNKQTERFSLTAEWTEHYCLSAQLQNVLYSGFSSPLGSFRSNSGTPTILIWHLGYFTKHICLKLEVILKRFIASLVLTNNATFKLTHFYCMGLIQLFIVTSPMLSSLILCLLAQSPHQYYRLNSQEHHCVNTDIRDWESFGYLTLNTVLRPTYTLTCCC